MLELFYTENWQKVPFNTECRISENPAERGKDEKDIKKIIALATALMMIPAITVSAASPINLDTDGNP